MKCPKCGNELRRSKKDPKYGLCMDCRIKVLWKNAPGPESVVKEDETAVPADKPEPESQSETASDSVPYRIPRLVLGLISLLLSLFIVFQSFAAGIFNALSANGEVSGTAGFLLACMMLVAGILTLCLKKRVSAPAFLVPAGFYLAGAVIAAANAGSYGDLKIWSAAAALAGSLHLFFFFKIKEKNAVLTWFVPVLVVVLVIALAVFTGKDGKKDTPKEDNGKEARKEDSEPGSDEEDTQVPDDGVLNFTADGFTAIYTRHEVSTDFEGNPCLIVYYNFTNTGTEATNAAVRTHLQVFQNGISLETAVCSTENAAISSYMTDVQPGTTMEIGQAFKITDMSPATLEMKVFGSIDDKKDTQILQLQE